MSMMVSFCAVLFPRGVLYEILNLIESVSEGFPSYFSMAPSTLNSIGMYNNTLIENCVSIHFFLHYTYEAL